MCLKSNDLTLKSKIYSTYNNQKCQISVSLMFISEIALGIMDFACFCVYDLGCGMLETIRSLYSWLIWGGDKFIAGVSVILNNFSYLFHCDVVPPFF